MVPWALRLIPIVAMSVRILFASWTSARMRLVTVRLGLTVTHWQPERDIQNDRPQSLLIGHRAI
jgi:hypothetical protein